MRLIYFDEAGIGDISIEPITVVAAVIINGDKEWSEIETHVDSIIQEFPKSNRAGTEFHAKDLFSGTRKNSDWGREKRWEILTAFLKTFERFQLPIVWGAADRLAMMKYFASDPKFEAATKLGDAVLPQLAAFSMCQLWVEIWFRLNAPDEKGICIVDPLSTFSKQGKIGTKVLEIVHLYWRKNRMWKELDLKNEHLIEAVSFVESHKSIGVQLSDACNFFVKRHISGMRDADSERFYGMIAPYVRNPWGEIWLGKPQSAEN